MKSRSVLAGRCKLTVGRENGHKGGVTYFGALAMQNAEAALKFQRRPGTRSRPKVAAVGLPSRVMGLLEERGRAMRLWEIRRALALKESWQSERLKVVLWMLHGKGLITRSGTPQRYRYGLLK